MTTNEESSENLFSYGTLQSESAQVATFGRSLEGKPDVLVGYRLSMIKIQQPDFVRLSGAEQHRNLQFTGVASDVVEGTMLKVTKKELEQADAYESGADYQRVLVELKSGANAWVYLHL
ncbi:MAG TPA: gamma-glutamylcyclotransferase family protein [Pyrinomonadaceae bacterium]|nr:gamma-glutamylcyclotransferase family protein [Pyrinomonadaceae bacterium]